MERPEYNDKTHVLTRRILDDGTSEYEVTPLPEEVAIIRSNPDSFREISLIVIRAERDRKLKASDWSVLYDIPMPEEKRLQWLEYRQELRDFPDTCDINNPIWPSMPIGD